MRSIISRSLALFLVALIVAPPSVSFAALSAAYETGYERYGAGDYRGVVSALQGAPGGDPNDALLLGLAQLRLDQPARAADAWGQFIKTSPDTALAGDIARLRTLVVREANRRGAKAAVSAGRGARVSGDVLAVLPFRNVGAPEYEPLGKAIAAMLTDSLGGVPNSRVVERGRVEAFLDEVSDQAGSDTKTARRVGALLGAGLVVVGAHVDTSTDPMTLEVDSALIDTESGLRLESGSFLAPLDRFYAAIRDTAVGISNRLGSPVSSLSKASAARMQAVHTESLDAALAFGRGLDHEDRGQFDDARREYEKALRADSSFRLARLRLATLPASSMSLTAVATVVQSELEPVAAPAVVAAAPIATPSVTTEAPAAAPTTDAQPEVVARTTDASTTTAATAGAVAGGASASKKAATTTGTPPEPVEEEETTILGMSPMTAALVGGGLVVVIGGAAAAAGGGGGGGGGGNNDPVRPPTLSGVQDRSVSAGDLIVLNIEGQDPEGSPVTLTQSGAPSAATFDTSRGNPATGTFRWQTTLSDGGQTVDVTFTATASRGPPNDTASESATLSVSSAPPTPTPPPTCGGTGASCTAPAECCQDIPRECDVTPAGSGTRCCLGLTMPCQIDGNCCGSDNACRGQQCCAPLGVSCTGASDCCDDGAACAAGSCCLPDGLSCANDSECCTGRCASGTCEGSAPPTPTPAPTPPLCVPQGNTCDAVFECCPGSDCEETPTSGQNICCAPLGDNCADDSICCGTNVGCDGACCLPLQSACSDASECCGAGAGCVLGRCCAAPSGACSSDQDCCAGSCLGGTCSSALSADASPVPTPSPTPAGRPTGTPTPTPASTPRF
ncbi:MAG: hypothetical protein P8R42_12570 [Candidatus Binatia bacterium]|nr:hypothetical protein [Candidatus Binatia bacterium]